MKKRAWVYRVGLAVVGCLIATIAHAHSLAATPYVLPVPFWMYVYGCAATLIVTFAVLGYFWNTSVVATDGAAADAARGRSARQVQPAVLAILRAGAVASLVLTIAAGLFGTLDPGRNVNILLFWVVFLLGFTYLTVIVGDLYSLINPWRAALDWAERAGFDLSTPRLRYPDGLGYWLAFLLYMALIWYELFALPQPFVLSIVLVVYTAITYVGVFLFGKEIWFLRCDVFSVFFRLVALLAPVEYLQGPDGRSWYVRFRPPVVGALSEPKETSISLVLFVIFMLSSTTYDALHQTTVWLGMYWRPMLSLLQPFWGTDLAKAQRMLEGGFIAYQRAGLVLSPFIYLAFYLVVLWLAKVATGVSTPVRRLAMRFIYSLVPIVLAYNVTHYYPMLLVEGGQLLSRLSDPFGIGWNPFNVAPAAGEEPQLEMSTVWHSQVVLIVIGHLISVYLAHVIALRAFPAGRRLVVSQVPLLFLMVALTAIGLWVLALPLAG